jgi:hypothetical protein
MYKLKKNWKMVQDWRHMQANMCPDLDNEHFVSLSSAQETVLMCLHPYEPNVGPELQDRDHEGGLNFVDSYLDGVQAGEMVPTHFMCSTEAWFFLDGYVNCHNKKNQLIKKFRCTLPSYDVKFRVCCAVSAVSITWPIFSDTVQLQGIATILTLKMIW